MTRRPFSFAAGGRQRQWQWAWSPRPGEKKKTTKERPAPPPAEKFGHRSGGKGKPSGTPVWPIFRVPPKTSLAYFDTFRQRVPEVWVSPLWTHTHTHIPFVYPLSNMEVGSRGSQEESWLPKSASLILGGQTTIPRGPIEGKVS